MHSPRNILVLPGLLVLSLVAGLSAQTKVTIETSKDNTLYQSSTGTLSNGRGTRCFTGTNNTSAVRRAVLAFDVAKQIPPCSKITKVELVLTAVMTASLISRTVTLHPLLADWGEGASLAGGGGGGQGGGGAAQTGDATWIHTFFNTKAWMNAGGDFNATASGTASVASTGKYTWPSTAQMVADVQSWLDQPGTNFGWLLLTTETTTRTAKAFATKEDSTAANRPQLAVTYTPPMASVTSTGTGCSGTGASPLKLSANGNPTVPNANFSLALTGGPNGTGLFGLALGLLSTPVPLGSGCLLYVDPSPVLVVLPGNANRVLALPIPNQTTLLGLKLSWQGAVGDSGVLVTSNALTLKLGN